MTVGTAIAKKSLEQEHCTFQIEFKKYNGFLFRPSWFYYKYIVVGILQGILRVPATLSATAPGHCGGRLARTQLIVTIE
jgi:hypothetical protein